MNKQKKITCDVCHHNCLIPEKGFGFCGTRQNLGSSIVNQAYGKVTALALDPIEKKPLYRFFPGSKILSIGSLGCNMTCSFCQNYHIAGAKLSKNHNETGIDTALWKEYSPEDLVSLAIQTKVQGNSGLAFTYNEPLINYEFIIDCAKYAKKKDSDLQIVLVTNGHLTEKYRKKLFPHIDAMNVDLKAFQTEFYTKMQGDFSLVKAFIEEAVQKAHIELTYLLIPGLNDDPTEIEEAAQWVSSLDIGKSRYFNSAKEIPFHISRFFPTHKLIDRNATSVSAVYGAVEIAKKYLDWVYPGNV